MVLSSLLNRFAEPETLKMAKLGRELRAQGHDITDLSLGEPDFDTPQHIKDAAHAAIDQNWTHYTPVAGYPELRQAVCDKLKRDNDLDYDPAQIIISTGAKQSLANAILSIVEEGDEVIIPTPYWVTYSALVQLAQGKVHMIKTDLEHQYKITPEMLEDAITPRTRLFIFSSPCNPSGAVYSKEELESLAEVFRRYPNILIISDEIYEYINYAGTQFSIARLEDMKERTIVVNGLSKGFAMTGWRLGYMAAPLELAKACDKLQGQFTSATCSITQRAAIVALTSPLDASMEMVKEFTKRRARVLQLMQEIPGMKFTSPDGAFYAFPDVSYYFGKKAGNFYIANADDLCMYLLHVAHVSTVTGSAFGNEECIRISFANSMENIEKGFSRISKALADLH